MGKLISGSQSLPRKLSTVDSFWEKGEFFSFEGAATQRFPMLEWMTTYLSRHVWAVLLTVLNSLVLKDMRLGGRGLGDDLQKCEWWIGERKHVWSCLIVYMYEIPKELIKDGEFFQTTFPRFVFSNLLSSSQVSQGEVRKLCLLCTSKWQQFRSEWWEVHSHGLPTRLGEGWGQGSLEPA